MMKQIFRVALATITLLMTVNTAVYAQSSMPENEKSFQHWLNDFKQQARQAGISEQTLNEAFKNIRPSPKVLDSDRKQPEFTRTFYQYFNSAVSKNRVNVGQKEYQSHQALFNDVSQKYGIPSQILASFWGMETNYGRYTGNIPIIQSLVTLAYDPRRTTFFSKQLMAALKIIDQGHVQPSQMKGSWAGAMGQVQFMPTNYLQYAVDGDGDGKINLWDSLPDAFHSAGHFLQTLGWNPEQGWGKEVTLPKTFDYALADGKTKRTLKAWKTLGVQETNGQPLKFDGSNNGSETQTAKLLLPSDYRGPAFLVYDNFQIIKRWNNSNNYALAVGHLSNRILGKPPLSKKQPKDDKGLSRDQMKQIQRLLNQLGYAAGEPDGIAGSKTRSALRAFQVAQKIPADGAPSYRMLQVLKKAFEQQNRSFYKGII
ncbi:MAG: lytic murein transglycosylase [Thiomicrorhabdus sp.]|nr:lytic murein transglycosylase [Thiomicrorhabdus sp.]